MFFWWILDHNVLLVDSIHMTIIYKIRRKSDGLFSMGGTTIRFTNVGRVWKRKSDLTNHINTLSSVDIEKYYEDCEIVTFELIEKETQSVVEYIDDRAQIKLERERQIIERSQQEELRVAEARIQRLTTEGRRKLYEQLKSKLFGNG